MLMLCPGLKQALVVSKQTKHGQANATGKDHYRMATILIYAIS